LLLDQTRGFVESASQICRSKEIKKEPHKTIPKSHRPPRGLGACEGSCRKLWLKESPEERLKIRGRCFSWKRLGRFPWPGTYRVQRSGVFGCGGRISGRSYNSPPALPEKEVCHGGRLPSGLLKWTRRKPQLKQLGKRKWDGLSGLWIAQVIMQVDCLYGAETPRNL